MSPSLSPFPPKLRNSESLACSSSSSTSFSSSSGSSSFSALFDRNSRTSSEWSDITPPTSPSQSLDGSVKSMHGGQSTIRAYSKAAFSEGLPTLLEDDEQADAPHPAKLAKTHNSSDVRGAPRKAHSFLRTKRAEPARNAEPRPIDKAAHPPQLIITSPDEDVEEWTESLQKRHDEASALQADAVHSIEDTAPQDIDENDDSFSIESAIEAWLDQAKLEGNEFPGVGSLLDEQFDFPSSPSDSDHSVSPPQLSPPRLSTVFRPILEPVPEDSVAPDVAETVVDRPATFWVLEPLPSPSLAPVPEEEEEELLSPESMYTQATANDPSETASLFLDADVDFSMPPTPRINPMYLGDSEFSPLILGSPKIRTTQTPSPRTPLSPRNRQDILHLASPLTTSEDSNHMRPMDVPAMMRLEIARTLANSHYFGQFTESASGFGLGLDLISEEAPLPSALFPSSHQLIDSSISYSSVHRFNDSDASDGPHHANPSEAFEESLVVDTEVVGLGLGKLAEAVLQSSSSVTSKMDDECLAAELNEAPLSTGREHSPHLEFRTLGRLEHRRFEAAQYELALEASTASGRQRLILGSDAAEALSSVPNSAGPSPHTSGLTPRSALSYTREGEQTSSPPKAPGPLISDQVLCTQVRSSRLLAPRLSPIQEDDSTPETFGTVDLDGDYGFVIVPSQEDGDLPTSSLAEHSLANHHPGAPRCAVQPTPQREASLNTEQQVAQASADLPPIKARSRGSRGALHPLLFVEPTPAELKSGSRGSDAQRPISAPSTSTPLTTYPGISKIPALRASQFEVKPHSFLLPSSNQSSGCSSSSSSSPPPSAKGKAPVRRRFSGGSKVHQTSEVEHAPSKNKKPAATKFAPAPVISAVPPTSFLSRFGLHRPSVAREYDDPVLRISVPSVLSAKTDPRSPHVEGQRPIAPPRLSRKAAPMSAPDHAPQAKSSSVKSTKTVGVLGRGLPSHLASRPPQPRDASSSSTRPLSSLVGASASAAAAPCAKRSTSPPRGFLQIARFAKRQLYAIPEVPTPSPTFSASAGSTPILQSPRKPGVLRRLLSPKKAHDALNAPPLPPQEVAAAKRSTAPQARRSSIPQPRQLPSRLTGPLGRQPPATANYHPSTTAVSEFRDLPAETDPGRSPLPFVEHADAPRNIGLLKRGANRAVEETSRTQMGSPFTRKLRCLF